MSSCAVGLEGPQIPDELSNASPFQQRGPRVGLQSLWGSLIHSGGSAQAPGSSCPEGAGSGCLGPLPRASREDHLTRVVQLCPLSATVKAGGPSSSPHPLSPCPPRVPCCDRVHVEGRGAMGPTVLHCRGLCFPHSDPRLRSHSWKARAHIQTQISECPEVTPCCLLTR